MAKQPHVYTVRNKKVVLDRELATVLGVETRVINQKVKRNIKLFNEDSMFQLTFDEYAELENSGSKSQNSGLISQFVISNNTGRGGVRKLPFAFTEAGVQVLKTLMKSSMDIDFSDEPPLPTIYGESWNEGTVVLYNPDDSLKLEVMIQNDTVWLSQEKMAQLFGTQRQAISKHLKNIYDSNELEKNQTCSILELVQNEGDKYVTRQIAIYNLDAIISVGFRVNTKRGIFFRQWAIKVLRDYALKRNGVNLQMQEIKDRLNEHDEIIKEQQKQIDFIVNTRIQPTEHIFMQGQFFDAYKLFSDLIRSAKERVIIIDNYVDESILKLLSKRSDGVVGVIYTSEKCYNNETFRLDLQKHNAQYPIVNVYSMNKVHDRFLIIDEVLYSSGGSFKDAGKKLFYFEKMELSPEEILNIICRQ
ncbi:MAG: ORF6N domain-containing protein [Paludibacteraceae bacterium]|nr:ORF6N domain-containing protein [Paludibacteraceae bacterium]